MYSYSYGKNDGQYLHRCSTILPNEINMKSILCKPCFYAEDATSHI